MNEKIKYYDFWVDVPKSNPKDWKYQALKIAAVNPEMAIYAKQLLHVGSNHKRTRIFNLGKNDHNNLHLGYLSIRSIVEFQLVRMDGKTRYTFKKIAEYKIDKSLKVREL